jgi:hypothetical protein
MSTRSNIYLKLKDESKGQTIKFDFSKLPTKNGEEHAELEFPIKDVTIPKDTLYMGVYHHWDGYLSGVGKTLLETYTDYDTILNLLCMGDLSTINGGVTSYQGWRNENVAPLFITKDTKVKHWKWDAKSQCSKVTEHKICDSKGNLKPKDAVREEYAYLFDGEKWWTSYFKYNEKTDKTTNTGWVELTEDLIENE